MKKVLAVLIAVFLMVGTMAACAGDGGDSSSSSDTEFGSSSTPTAGPSSSEDDTFDAGKDITVISREEGSGTRGAFTELFGVLAENADGEEVDAITVEAIVSSSTSVMLTTIAGDPYAIGYVSLGSLNDTVKALKIDGAEATTANVASGDYKISRPFNIATKEGLSDVAQDFVDFLMSADGQKIISDGGYIAVPDSGAYTASGLSGEVVIAGSSSVTPIMEVLKEAYVALNPDVAVEIQMNDSSMGMQNTIDDVCDIGMASRTLKDTELAEGLISTTIAIDGIAVIVNNANPNTDVSAEAVKGIFLGETLTWDSIA